MTGSTTTLLALIGAAFFIGGSGGNDASNKGKPPTPKKPNDDSSDLLGRNIDIPVKGRISSVLGDKRSHGPHQGIDIAAPAGSVVRAWGAGKVVRVVDGRQSDRDSAKRAGLWVDVAGDDGNTHRYLHLGKAFVSQGARVIRGQDVGTVEKDHLHFEIRQGLTAAYGAPQDPVV